LIDDHPYRDRACGLLMTALALEGRQTEALRAFNDHRTRLIDDVGIDPSEDLVELDRRIAMGESVAPLAVAAPSHPDDGLLTFMFTDIVGSTARWDEDPEAMAAALMRCANRRPLATTASSKTWRTMRFRRSSRFAISMRSCSNTGYPTRLC
jgi:DNA-binding SARP family transcriptional activator